MSLASLTNTADLSERRMFVPIDQFTATSLATCADGLFRTARMTPAGAHMLVTTDQDGRYAILLDEGAQRFQFFQIEQNWGSLKGTIVAAARIEVDPTSSFDPERGETLGDLVLVGKVPAVIAKSGGGSWADPMRFYLGEVDKTQRELATGFRRWRYVVGPEATPLVLWEHSPLSEPMAV